MITLLLILKFLKSTKLTPHILFIFFFLLHHDVFVSPVLLFFQFKKKFITHLVFFFFLWLEKVEILNYNKCKLLIFTQKIEESLSTRVSVCSRLVIITRIITGHDGSESDYGYLVHFLKARKTHARLKCIGQAKAGWFWHYQDKDERKRMGKY